MVPIQTVIFALQFVSKMAPPHKVTFALQFVVVTKTDTLQNVTFELDFAVQVSNISFLHSIIVEHE